MRRNDRPADEPAMQLARAFSRASTIKRLWLAGTAWGVFLATVVVGNQFLPNDKAVSRTMIGHDFLAFYAAGTLVREGRAHELYNLETIRQLEQATGHAAGLEMGDSFGPWWNPPFYALVFAPLAALPYATALVVWRWIGLAAVAGAMGILATFVQSEPRTEGTPAVSGRRPKDRLLREYPPCAALLKFARRTSAKWLLVLSVVTSMPFVQSFSHGQNTFTSLLILSATVALWRRGRATAAGLVGGLLFYKPQLGAIVAVAMMIDLGVTAAAGLAVTAGILAVITTLALPGSIGDWLTQLPANVRYMQVEHDYLWERHVTIKAFWRLVLQGRHAGEPWVVTTVLTDISLLAIGLVFARMLWSNRHSRGVRRDRLIAATVTTMPLLMPFYFDYDLLLLATAATLYAADPCRSARLTAGWCTLFAWLFVNPFVGLHGHVDVTVLLLTGISVGSMRRVGHSAVVAKIEPQMHGDLVVRRAA